MQKQRMRIGPMPKLEWKTIAITAEDPIIFARELQTALQELTDSGFNITGQLQRGTALVISASRLHAPEAQAAPLRRRIVDLPSARQVGAPAEEVLYHFTEYGAPQQKAFPTLIDALRLLAEHLKKPQEHILPVNITTLSMTRFEPESFAYLLRMFAEDLQPPPG